MTRSEWEAKGKADAKAGKPRQSINYWYVLGYIKTRKDGKWL